MTTVVEMEVTMDCPGCESKVKKALKKIKGNANLPVCAGLCFRCKSGFGVHDVQIDMKQQKVTVTGWAEAKKVLKVARSVSAGKEVCLWPHPYSAESNGYNDRYFKKKFRKKINMSKNGEKVSSYNYYEHGYHGHEHGYCQERPGSGLINENAVSMFSEDNPHFCTIM